MLSIANRRLPWWIRKISAFTVILSIHLRIREWIYLSRLEANEPDADYPWWTDDRGWRLSRFPSVEQRVKHYMSNWYAPPCDSTTGVRVSKWSRDGTWVAKPTWYELGTSSIAASSAVETDTVFYAAAKPIINCTYSPTNNLRFYCRDARDTLLNATAELDIPILMQFGDLDYSLKQDKVDIPVLKKYRNAMSLQELYALTSQKCYRGRPRVAPSFLDRRLQPIIWNLNSQRHYARLAAVSKFDIPWENKTDMAVFYGNLNDHDANQGSLQMNQFSLDVDKCLELPRCRLVLMHNSSELVDAKLTKTFGRVPDVVAGVRVVGDRRKMDDLLQYKALIMLEGNDVSSGLKWGLLSNSVVMMPRPKFSSWAMEDFLVPWVHYVPLEESLNDVERKMEWILDHPKEAQEIARRGTLWMNDLLYDPISDTENKWINQEILWRYKAHFRISSIDS
jgi:hypothetical protein